MTDPYKILGITQNATDDEVKKAYRNMCRKYHPDKNPGNEAAEEMFKIVQESYEAIMDQRKNGGTYTGSYGGYAGTGTQTGSSESTYYQAAANYINNRHFSEAMKVLMQIRERNAQWYYLSALANAGLGNNYVAQEQARTAAAMEPGNMYYASLVNRLSGGAYRYDNMQQPYGSNMYYGDNFCLKLCALNICINACCDGDCCCCC
jgi:molecular chaperone DnaJ